MSCGRERQLWDRPRCPFAEPRMTGFGAFPSLAAVPAKVPSRSDLPTFVIVYLIDWLPRTAADGLGSGPIRSRNAICGSAQIAAESCRGADGARSRCAAKKRRSSPPGCRSCAVARLATPRGSAAPGAPTPHPSDRSDMRRPPLDISDGAPPSTSLFAITVRPVTVKRPIRPDATRFWSGSKALKGGLTLTVQPLRSYLFRSVAAPIDVKLVDCCRLGDPTCDWSEVWAT